MCLVLAVSHYNATFTPKTKYHEFSTGNRIDLSVTAARNATTHRLGQTTDIPHCSFTNFGLCRRGCGYSVCMAFGCRGSCACYAAFSCCLFIPC